MEMSRQKKERARAKIAARRLPASTQDVAFTKWTKHGAKTHRDRQLGTFGAAGPVRQIDPKTYEVKE
jgi:hypothetical protein